MTIKSIKEIPKKKKIEIDLTGPNRNAFVLLGIASDLAKQLDKDWPSIRSNMTSGNYDHLLEIFDIEFGDFVTLYR